MIALPLGNNEESPDSPFLEPTAMESRVIMPHKRQYPQYRYGINIDSPNYLQLPNYFHNLIAVNRKSRETPLQKKIYSDKIVSHNRSTFVFGGNEPSYVDTYPKRGKKIIRILSKPYKSELNLINNIDGKSSEYGSALMLNQSCEKNQMPAIMKNNSYCINEEGNNQRYFSRCIDSHLIPSIAWKRQFDYAERGIPVEECSKGKCVGQATLKKGREKIGKKKNIALNLRIRSDEKDKLPIIFSPSQSGRHSPIKIATYSKNQI